MNNSHVLHVSFLQLQFTALRGDGGSASWLIKTANLSFLLIDFQKPRDDVFYLFRLNTTLDVPYLNVDICICLLS